MAPQLLNRLTHFRRPKTQTEKGDSAVFLNDGIAIALSTPPESAALVTTDDSVPSLSNTSTSSTGSSNYTSTEDESTSLHLSASSSSLKLQDELDEVRTTMFETTPAELVDIMVDKAEQLAMSGIVERCLKEGDIAPHFRLPDGQGNLLSINDLIATGPVILTFYRGNWCPYCCLALKALQAYLPEFKAKGASMVAVSPQTPDYTAITVDKRGLTYSVLSDAGCRVANEYGIVFDLDPELRTIYQDYYGINIPMHNGDTSFKLPVTATYVVDTDGTVLYSFVNSDFTKRAEPEEILKALPDYGNSSFNSWC